MVISKNIDSVKMNNQDKLITQGSLENSQEKLRKYIHYVVTKQNRSVLDQIY